MYIHHHIKLSDNRVVEVYSYQREICQLQQPLHLVCTERTLHYANKIFGVNLSEHQILVYNLDCRTTEGII